LIDPVGGEKKEKQYVGGEQYFLIDSSGTRRRAERDPKKSRSHYLVECGIF
jgi:hypothetical protein